MSVVGGVFEYGHAERFKPSSKTDHVVVVNEDLGFTATLAAGVNDNLETSLPLPQEWDQDTEVVMLEQINFGVEGVPHHADDSGAAFSLSLSYLDRSPAATYRGLLADAEDEYIKSIFAAQMMAGELYFSPSAVAAVEVNFIPTNPRRRGRYTPPFNLMMGHQPLYLEVIGNRFTSVLATGNETAADFSVFEQTKIDYWYHIARMPKPLRDLMATLNGLPFRLGLLSS